MRIKVLSVTFHRNGVMGNGFYVVLFTHGNTKKVAVVFDEPGNVAVLDVELLGQDVIDYPNRWRGDEYEPELRKAVSAYVDAL